MIVPLIVSFFFTKKNILTINLTKYTVNYVHVINNKDSEPISDGRRNDLSLSKIPKYHLVLFFTV